jgi:hypothetical protein
MKKILAICFVLCALSVVFTLSAHAQNQPGCSTCAPDATCSKGPSGGCGCIQVYDPHKGRRVCAYCGFCIGAICFYPCGHGAVTGAATAQPAWAANAELVARVQTQSDAMSALFKIVQQRYAADQCNALRGTMVENGVKTAWSAAVTSTGGLTILMSTGGHSEQLFIEGTNWGLARDGANVYSEAF